MDAIRTCRDGYVYAIAYQERSAVARASLAQGKCELIQLARRKVLLA
jgi:hypothetical protein